MDQVSCVICLTGIANQPTLCRHCNKVFCDGCLKTYLDQVNGSKSCPHCRRAGSFFKLELVTSLLEEVPKADVCKKHRRQETHFCSDCKVEIIMEIMMERVNDVIM